MPGAQPWEELRGPQGGSRDELGLPLLPPLPHLEGGAPAKRGSLLRAVATARTALTRVELDGGEAMLAFAGGELVDACGCLEGEVVTGLAVLDQLEGRLSSAVEVSTVPEPVARSLPRYWRDPVLVHALPARVTDPAAFVRSLLREDQSGVVLVETPGDLGLLFFEAGVPSAVYSRGRPVLSGVETLSDLCSDPSALLHARLREATAGRADKRAPDDVMREVELLCRARLHMHAERAIAVLRPAVLGQKPLAEATADLANMRLRLVSPATMAELAEQARRILEPDRMSLPLAGGG